MVLLALPVRAADLAPELWDRPRSAQAVMAQAQAHLWLPPSWRDAIAALHQDNAQGLGALLARLDDAREGFATLPVDDALAGDAPRPVSLAA